MGLNKEIVNFSIEVVNAETLNPNISRYKCYICYPDEPANKYIFSKKVLEDMIPSVVGTGVYTYYSEKLEKFGGHEGNIVTNGRKTERTGELKAVGFVDTATMPFWEKRNVNGKNREYLTSYVYLWSGIHPILKDLDKLKIFQSMEVETAGDKVDGFIIVKKALMQRLVLIGDNPAFDGSTFAKFQIDENSLNLLKAEYSNILIKKDMATIIKEKELLKEFKNVNMDNLKFKKEDINTDIKKDEEVDESQFSDVEFALPREKWGTGEALNINKSKEALSNTAWGDVDKTALRWKILRAKNYKTLVNSVYLRVGSNWEDSPSSDLSYPVMQVKGDEVVYNAGGLSSALGFSRAHNHNDVTSKVLAIRKKMGIDDEEGKMKDKFSKLKKENILFSASSENGIIEFIDVKSKFAYQFKEGKLLKFTVVEKMNDNDNDNDKDEDDMIENECSFEEFIRYANDKFAEIKREEESKEAKFGEVIIGYQTKEAEMTAKIANIETEKKDIEAKFEKIKEDFTKAEFTIKEYGNKTTIKNVNDFIEENCKNAFTESEKADFIKECVNFTQEENETKILAKYGKKVIEGSISSNGRANFTVMSTLNPKLEQKEIKNDPYKLVSVE